MLSNEHPPTPEAGNKECFLFVCESAGHLPSSLAMLMLQVTLRSELSEPPHGSSAACSVL